MRSRLPSLVVLASALLVGCDTQTTLIPPPAPLVFGTDTGAAAYFGTPVDWIDTVWLEISARSLAEMQAPPLRGSTVPEGTTVMRFVALLSPRPSIVVQVVRTTASCTVVSTVWKNESYRLPPIDTTAGAIGPRVQLKRDSSMLRDAACHELAGRLDALGLKAAGPHIASRGADGFDWIFERLDARGHTLVMRWSPECGDDCKVFNAGMAFLRAGNAVPAGPHELY